MNEKEYIEKIIEQTTLTKEEIKNLIKEKKKEYRGFLTTQAAYSYVCEDLGININNKESKKEESNMKDEEVETIKPESGLREIDKKMALTVHDENEGVSVKNELIITHYPSEEEILFLIKRRKFVKEKLIDNSDKLNIGGNLFLKKSAWRKYINAFGISIDILSERVYETDKGDVIAEYRVKAIAPNNQSVVADGTKSKSEYWSVKYNNYGSYTLHNLKATARTRAINIAVSDLVGYGETSAEEHSGKELRKAVVSSVKRIRGKIN